MGNMLLVSILQNVVWVSLDFKRCKTQAVLDEDDGQMQLQLKISQSTVSDNLTAMGKILKDGR